MFYTSYAYCISYSICSSLLPVSKAERLWCSYYFRRNKISVVCISTPILVFSFNICVDVESYISRYLTVEASFQVYISNINWLTFCSIILTAYKIFYEVWRSKTNWVQHSQWLIHNCKKHAVLIVTWNALPHKPLILGGSLLQETARLRENGNHFQTSWYIWVAPCHSKPLSSTVTILSVTLKHREILLNAFRQSSKGG